MVKTSCSDVQRTLRWDEHDPKYPSKKQVSLPLQRTRSGKSSKEKWSGNDKEKVDPRQKSFTPQEEDLVIQLHSAIGSRWPIIAQQLPGKTDNDVKILWNSKLRKKLAAMGIDPVTHRPFSQILADYGNIGAFPKARTRFTSLSKDLKNAAATAIVSKPELHKSPQSFVANRFPSPPKQEFSDHHNHPVELYSQLQAVNFITEASNYAGIESESNQEISSFSWSDFFIEDAFSGMDGDGGVEIEGKFPECDGGGIEAKGKSREVEGFDGFEGSSSSNSYSFVDAMLEGQDAIFTQLSSCFSEEPFYY